ncbi:MAG TPA: hypothetical protein VMU68_03600 [Acidimicrobiales bacterium]|nr:hypothetical protein [Acidimicrobiales bacterium]
MEARVRIPLGLRVKSVGTALSQRQMSAEWADISQLQQCAMELRHALCRLIGFWWGVRALKSLRN